MLQIDTSSFTVTWNTTVNDEVAGSSWAYYGLEAADDVTASSIKGFDVFGQFTSYYVDNRRISLLSNQDWTYPLSTDPSEMASITCWSDVCPGFIHFDSTDKTMWSRKSDTMVGPVNGTYIYYVELRDSTTKSLKNRFTMSLVMTKVTVTSPININLPFDLWAVINKGSLPYYVPPVNPLKDRSSFNEKGFAN
jgi:hypothetical protein